MNSIEIMVKEHEYILRMLKVLREASRKVMKGEEINYEDFGLMTDFVANYADGHHHGKEEKFLFNQMINELGRMGTNLVTHGMLVEHDWGRLFMSELKSALARVRDGDEDSRIDVIANAVGYANHLNRHIEKENQVVFTFAEKALKPEIMDLVNKQTEQFEADAAFLGTQTHYIEMLEKLEEKYL